MSTVSSGNVQLDYAVDIHELSKQFKRTAKIGGYTSIKSLISNYLSGSSKNRALPTIQAIKDLTIKVPRGASVGIIGRNGSGKSTLLKLITGIYRPDEGYVKINGQIRALIELGAGFHPDFTGRENLYLAGVLYGLSRKDIDQKFAEIVRFAELEDFIDEPVRTYSSGMFMRLGFSLAVNTNPDILLIDEVLAVGDARFVSKCQDKISELRREQKTLFMVSHDLSAIERWSDEVIWLDHGVVMDRGEPRRVIDKYLTFVNEKEASELEQEETHEAIQLKSPASNDTEDHGMEYQRWGSREIEISQVKISDESGSDKHLFASGDAITITFQYSNHQELAEAVFGFAINRLDGMHVIGTNTELERVPDVQLNSSGSVTIDISNLNIQTGTYFLDLAVHRSDGYPYDYHKSVVKFKVKHIFDQVGIVNTQHQWSIS